MRAIDITGEEDHYPRQHIPECEGREGETVTLKLDLGRTSRGVVTGSTYASSGPGDSDFVPHLIVAGVDGKSYLSAHYSTAAYKPPAETIND
jgi:hypothetical protein